MNAYGAWSCASIPNDTVQLSVMNFDSFCHVNKFTKIFSTCHSNCLSDWSRRNGSPKCWFLTLLRSGCSRITSCLAVVYCEDCEVLCLAGLWDKQPGNLGLISSRGGDLFFWPPGTGWHWAPTAFNPVIIVAWFKPFTHGRCWDVRKTRQLLRFVTCVASVLSFTIPLLCTSY
jgi:hypothetical protein